MWLVVHMNPAAARFDAVDGGAADPELARQVGGGLVSVSGGAGLSGGEPLVSVLFAVGEDRVGYAVGDPLRGVGKVEMG